MDTICQGCSPCPILSQYHTVLKDALIYGKSHMCILLNSDYIYLFIPLFLSFAKSIYASKANFYSSHIVTSLYLWDT